MSTPQDKTGALDAAVAAWFGITTVAKMENILRARMDAAVHAYLRATGPLRPEPTAAQLLDLLEFIDVIGGAPLDATPDQRVRIERAAEASRAGAPEGLCTTGCEAGAAEPAMSQAARDVLAERQRQVSVEGWTPEHDDQHDAGDMAAAAACYALLADAGPSLSNNRARPMHWPWDRRWWKPGPTRRMLEKAGALIIAEIERLDRAASRTPTPPSSHDGGAA